MGKFFHRQLNRFLVILLVGVAFVGVQFAFASDELFQNKLLKMDVHKTSQGGVNVTLFTTKPYKDSIAVTKKSDFEYIILMPETASSMTAKPAINSAVGILQKIEVKTQQYSPEQGQKGYTKITFSTTKPVEINPQVQTIKVADYQLSENEYKELLAQASKKSVQPSVGHKPASVKPTLQVNKKEQVLLKTPTVVQKTVKKQTQQAVTSPVQKIIKTEPVKKVSKPENKVVKPILLKTIPNKIVETKPVALKEVQSPTVEEEKAAVEQKPVVETVAQTKVPSEVQAVAPVEATKAVGRYQKYKNIIKKHAYLILALIFIPLLFLLLLLRAARKNVQNHEKQKNAFSENLDEKPSPVVDYTERISDDMSWKEKYQTFIDASSPNVDTEAQAAAHAEQILENNEYLDDLFAEEEILDEYEEVSQVPEESSSLDEFLAQEHQATSEVSVEELFNDEEDALEDNFSDLDSFEDDFTMNIDNFSQIEEPQEENQALIEIGLSSQSNFAIDNYRGLCLVDYEDATALVGYIGEDVFVLKRFDGLVKSDLRARLSESKGSCDDYMVKIGSFKSIVEVTPDNMSMLIEL